MFTGDINKMNAMSVFRSGIIVAKIRLEQRLYRGEEISTYDMRKSQQSVFWELHFFSFYLVHLKLEIE